MRVMKWSMIALAVSAGTSQLAFASAQDESKGFIEDSQLNVKTRMLYFSRDFRNNPAGSQSRVEETGLGFLGTYESGFTQGTVGFGVDAIGMLGLKLDSGKGRAGTGLFPQGSDGRSQDDYSEGGGAVKMRISNTVLKFGDQFTAMPVFATDDSRLLPEVAEGGLITSNEINGLTLNAGHFTAMNAQAQTYHDSLNLTEANIFGGTYAFTDSLSTSVYYSHIEDHFRKWYGNINWALPISDKQGLVFDFNIYDTKSIGANRTGAFVTKSDGTNELDNIAASLSAAYNIGAHTFTLAYQKVSGDGDYAYGVDGGGTVFLANSIARSDFNAEDEKSWQARYDLNFAEFGVPGLTFMTRYARGTGATTRTTDDGKEWERDVDVKYVMQSGPAKDLSFRVRQATYRSSDGVYYGSSSIDELRLIVEYPLSIL
ncbi:OprD family porin [Pseudomonas kermanshahensis]|uniref:OprD family porin n=1 Tax=Pseudomonas kermanshahensis TaxID=2745482 RepID=A0ABU8R8D2_9PSED|nr:MULTISPECIES: OprD family porin [Pseudomonas]MBC3498413.1 OprD family porin [Pseudomonas sp. SWRI67]MBV4528293.1 OprD family porin [Pseudomonas kermanshahensis]SMF00163.1 imipenem/basic amino acid-specific outer membrane pore [Pseudomonas sp. LAIL14HWK12:I11]SMR72178.1 imipenem/basic amino acid-specific outer membrane pore [Pseudomonas sp. LAIL14HWK12:I10]SOD01111.1 imipenem/basic amino acid-specific outer membrane pore [Pseudomonas sp. LAIL14HWK12:I8]